MVHMVLGLMKISTVNLVLTAVCESENRTVFHLSCKHRFLFHIPAIVWASFLTYWQTNPAHSEPLFSAHVSHSKVKHSISSPLWCHFCTFPPDHPATTPLTSLSSFLFSATSSPVKEHKSSYNYPLYSQEHLNRSLFLLLKKWPIVSVRGWSGTQLTPTESPENWPFPINPFPPFAPITH